VFISQIKHAISCRKPIIIHTRKAEEGMTSILLLMQTSYIVDTFQIMKEHIPRDWPLHVHCFTDSLEFALRLIQEWENVCIIYLLCLYFSILMLQIWFGFTGAITFKNSVDLRNVVKGIPLDHVVLETGKKFIR
jgi:TatD DNase family protein